MPRYITLPPTCTLINRGPDDDANGADVYELRCGDDTVGMYWDDDGDFDTLDDVEEDAWHAHEKRTGESREDYEGQRGIASLLSAVSDV